MKDHQGTIGSSGFMAAFGGGTDTNQASYQVMIEDSASYKDVQKRVEAGLKKLDGIGTTTVAAGDGFGSQDLSVVVKAADAGVLRTAAEQVPEAVAGLDDVTDVTSDLSQSVPRISVEANAKAAAAGFIAQPLAVVVIGGLITSTLLTLLLVPTLYAMLELRKERRARKRAAKRQPARPEKTPEPAGV